MAKRKTWKDLEEKSTAPTKACDSDRHRTSQYLNRIQDLNGVKKTNKTTAKSI